jgi:hypothetical protein
MTYAVVVDVAAPVEMYDAMHREIVAESGGDVAGLLVHVGRGTGAGFQILEIWDSVEHFNHYNDTIVVPVMQRMAAGSPGPAPQQNVTEFEVHGLVVDGGGVLV